MSSETYPTCALFGHMQNGLLYFPSLLSLFEAQCFESPRQVVHLKSVLWFAINALHLCDYTC